MSVREETKTTALPRQPIGVDVQLARLLSVDAERLAYLAIFVLAVLTRFWELGVRVMSHDESLHTRYSWNLYQGQGFSHTPLMHGPLLFHMTALNYLLFGDNDFTSRIYTAIVGIVVVMLPILMRRWLGKLGALAASVFFLISPLILYYSRYIRHDMPAILGALVMAIAIWRYIEDRRFKYLIWLAVGQVILFMSKEVSFIYIAIFGSFLTLYFVNRLLSVAWADERWRRVFAGALVAIVVALLALGAALALQGQTSGTLPGTEGTEAETMPPLDPDAALAEDDVPGLQLGLPAWIALGMLIAALIAGAVSVIAGQWPNLRRFPELDTIMVIGTLILPALTPFLIHFAGFNPTDSSQAGVVRSAAFTAPALIISVLLGLVHFMKPPEPRRVRITATPTDEERARLGASYDPATSTVEVQPDWLDWLGAALSSRWWAIAGPYWLLFVFFFTTMFTNGSGIGTGLIGSLGYWLEQHDVKRGGQPWYYYIMVMVPIYEFLPAILATVAGALGLRRWIAAPRAQTDIAPGAEADQTDNAPPAPRRTPLDLAAPVAFPVLLFTGYWAVLNLVAYSIAGEKMPWLTTHLTTPMILLAGWVVGRLLEGINWRRLWQAGAWPLLLFVPLLVVSLLRGLAPLCSLWQANPLCNSIVPLRYLEMPFQGHAVTQLATTGTWIAAMLVSAGALATVLFFARRLGRGQLWRLVGLLLVGWLTVLTVRAAWRATYVDYDYPTEFLVYAHSAGSVKVVMGQIEEISLKTTDGYGLRVAYDNRVSWPMSWYLRDYTNAVYFGDQPSRGLIGDAPVILAGPSNWPRVESLLGDRYYQFEYIRMWWPMQDYFGYEDPQRMATMLGDVLRDPALQRGLWGIFYHRDYNAYADAVAAYRGGNRPTFELSQWPVPDRMRVYIRKDIFAQVWDYGVAASEIAQVVDPYAAGARVLTPEQTFAQGLLNRPHGSALGPDGLLYVADSANHRIAVFDREGRLVRTLGSYGLAPQPDALNEPWDVAVGPDGTVFIADTWNHRVVSYDAQGNFRLTWGYEGPQQTDSSLAFWGPRGIAVDAEGNVYVADTGNKRVMVFDPDGDFIRQIGSGGGLPGQLDEPAGLAVGDDGLLYVADSWNQRIQVFTSEGLFMREWTVEAWFAQSNERPYLAVDSARNVYVTDPDGSRVIVFDAFGEYQYSFGDYTTIGLAGSVLADDGHLFVVDTERGSLQRYAIEPPASPEQP